MTAFLTTIILFILYLFETAAFHALQLCKDDTKKYLVGSPLYSSSYETTSLQDQDYQDDDTARSPFGTKSYWDDLYGGGGDFPADEYSWYYGWETLGKHVRQHLPLMSPTGELSKILIPGIGNDPILIDLLKAGYRRLTAQDYSVAAIERQNDLLWYESKSLTQDIDLLVGNVKSLPMEWTHMFDGVIEKGLLDAVYLSGDGQVEIAAEELQKVIKPGGILVSVSGVLPHDLRMRMFSKDRWIWLRDGSEDLKAGCFILQKIDVVTQINTEA